MAEKALYVLAGYDAATEEKLSGMQNTLYELGYTGTQTRNIPQHITLGRFSTDEESELVVRMQAAAETTAPFAVMFNHIGLFGGSKVLFAAPDCSNALLRLKENFGDSFGWTPHSTLLIDEPDVVLQALPEVMKEFSRFQGEITSLHLYEFFPARHILTVLLKKAH